MKAASLHLRASCACTLAHSVFGCWSFGFNQKQFSQNKDAVIINTIISQCTSINTEVAWYIAHESESVKCLVGKSGDIVRQRNHLLSLAFFMFMSFFIFCMLFQRHTCLALLFVSAWTIVQKMCLSINCRSSTKIIIVNNAFPFTSLMSPFE